MQNGLCFSIRNTGANLFLCLHCNYRICNNCCIDHLRSEIEAQTLIRVNNQAADPLLDSPTAPSIPQADMSGSPHNWTSPSPTAPSAPLQEETFDKPPTYDEILKDLNP